MRIIQDSPEHHFLTFIDEIRQKNDGWHGFHFKLFAHRRHEQFLENFSSLKESLKSLREESDVLLEALRSHASDDSLILYQFTDGDLVLVSKTSEGQSSQHGFELFKFMEQKIGPEACDQSNLSKELYQFQKMADVKFLSASRIRAYQKMADEARVQSIALRRSRRDDPTILIVEDDRFTASYAAGLLNKDYDVVIAKTGEDAILQYIDHAPDAVLLDIHLPGLNGLQTLKALKKIDQEAFVWMLSVDTVKQNIVEASDDGAAGFLKKPFIKDRLMHAIKKSPFL